MFDYEVDRGILEFGSATGGSAEVYQMRSPV
jgi:hypothetical protein